MEIKNIRTWKQQKAYIIEYTKGWHMDLLYASTLRAYCEKYGIPMHTYNDLKNMLMIPRIYLPKNFFGLQ